MTSDSDNLKSRIPGASCMEKVLSLYADNIHSDIEPWIKGIEGEQETARFLGLLGPEWKTLHSIPLGPTGRDIDHLVIGPTGVFVINSKNHHSANALVSGGKIIIGRQPWPEPASALKDANQVAEILTTAAGFPVSTTGVVSLVGVNRITIGDEFPVTVVLHARGLARMIQQLRANQGLDSEQIDQLYTVASKAATWGSAQQHEPQYISSRYESVLIELKPSMISIVVSKAEFMPKRNRSDSPRSISKRHSYGTQPKRSRRKSKSSPISAFVAFTFLLLVLKALTHHV